MTETDCGRFHQPGGGFVAESVFVATIPALTGAGGIFITARGDHEGLLRQRLPGECRHGKTRDQSLLSWLYLNILFAMSLVSEIAIIIPFPHQKNLMA